MEEGTGGEARLKSGYRDHTSNQLRRNAVIFQPGLL